MAKILIFLVLAFPFSGYGQCDRYTDSLVLVELHTSTDGANWTIPWDLKQSMDTWYGVFLNSSGCVKCIDLDGFIDCAYDNFGAGGNNLIGEIPQSISQLSEVEQLSLGFNKLAGNIPSLMDLTTLKFLSLGNNLFTGPIPASFSQLQNLEALLLRRNSFTGAIPSELGLLANLKLLNLSDNLLTGTLPSELGSLDRLNVLYLHNNSLTGAIPEAFANLTDLKYFNVSNNHLTGAVPGFLADMNFLLGLNFANNEFTGCFPDSMRKHCDIYVYFLGNDAMPWKGDFNQFCNSDTQIGARCEDSLYYTINTIDEECNCVSMLPESCICRLEGQYHAITTGTGVWGEVPCNSVWEGPLEFIETDVPQEFQIYTLRNGVYLEDMSFGAYYACYGVENQGPMPNGNLRFVNQCDYFEITGLSQYTETYTIISAGFSNDTFIMDITNSFSESFTTRLTRIDHKSWEDLSCDFDQDDDSYLLDVDCNDLDSTINPGAIEIAGNGIDENCDGDDFISGIEDAHEQNLMVFPNPVSGFLTIQFDDGVKNVECILYSIDGQLVDHFTTSTYQMSHLQPGIYLLVIKNIDTGIRSIVKIAKQ